MQKRLSDLSYILTLLRIFSFFAPPFRSSCSFHLSPLSVVFVIPFFAPFSLPSFTGTLHAVMIKKGVGTSKGGKVFSCPHFMCSSEEGFLYFDKKEH